ncbi:MAG: DUF302 domain-containing protein [Amphritea sp.]|nr:DUF302 domain-containing protein [Amphritea sp.]
MKKIVAGAVMGVAASGAVQAVDGLVNVESAHSVVATADKLESVLKDKGMTIFARIDHSAGAEKVGQSLRDTELVLFGNPQVGTKLMNCAQSVGIDLPLKALIWKDEQGKVWLSYNDPAYLADRHSIEGCDPVLEKVSGALAKFSAAATK